MNLRHVTFLAAVLAPLAGCGPADEAAPTGAASVLPPAPAGKPLAVGDKLPLLSAEGWVNGPPAALDAPGVRLTVVDLWGAWCPYCRMSAPELVKLHQKYAARGVAFVSLTNGPRGSAEALVAEFSLPWPNGYGAPRAALPALGVTSGMLMPGYEIAPTVYLVGPDGRVKWADSQGRYQHTQPAAWGRQLDDAIAAALADAPPTKKAVTP